MRHRITKKAFENQVFLNSRDARPIRILSEYLYPHHVLEKQHVTDTIVFFGSSRILSNESSKKLNAQNHDSVDGNFTEYYESARKLAGEITHWSIDIAEPLGRRVLVCTGGGPGIMEASNRGAYEAGGDSIGLNIELPLEQASNPYISQELNFDFHYFFTRKYWMLYYARVLIVFPGGFGTLDELFETLTLQQTKNHQHPIPVVLYGAEFWNKLVNFDFLAQTGMISPEDLNLIQIVDSVDEALSIVMPILKTLL